MTLPKPNYAASPAAQATIFAKEEKKEEANEAASKDMASVEAASKDNAVSEQEVKKEEEEVSLEDLDSIDYARLQQLSSETLLNSEEQRKLINSMVEPIDVAQLVIENTARQKVPIKPGVFEPTFQTISGEVELAIKDLLTESVKGKEYSDQYLIEKYSFMSLTAAVYAINDQVLPSFLDSNGNFDKKLFMKKFNIIVKFPLPMLTSLGIHYFWFDLRCREAFKVENLKGGSTARKDG
jgi:hypothetical protein